MFIVRFTIIEPSNISVNEEARPMASGKKWYYVFWMSQKNFELQSTEKAFYVNCSTGHWGSGHERPVWFPKSQCRFEEANDVGNFRVHIPCWLVDNKTEYQPMRLDIEYFGRVQM